LPKDTHWREHKAVCIDAKVVTDKEMAKDEDEKDLKLAIRLRLSSNKLNNDNHRIDNNSDIGNNFECWGSTLL
jgi:hypothetical protein